MADTSSAPRPARTAKRAGGGNAAWEVIETIAIAVILFFVMRLLVLPVKVDGQSMLPSLTPDQHLLVNRRAYTHWEIGGHTYYLYGPPHRGDIIVLTPPPVELRQGIPFIKRIVGLPGDTVLVTGGKVLINGKPLDEPYIAEPPAYTWPANGQPLTVPPHNVVVFGDNRNHSEDSSRFGLLDERLIRGRAFLTFYPIREINFLPKPVYA
jgi:signal peptidase I